MQLFYDGGFIVSDLFDKRIKYFISSAGCNIASKVFGNLNSYSSHKILKDNRVILLYRLPHSIHCRQPHYVSFFEPLNTYYNREMSTSLKASHGRTVMLHQVFFGEWMYVLPRCINITRGFEKNWNLFVYQVFSGLFVSTRQSNWHSYWERQKVREGNWRRISWIFFV